MHSKGLSQKMSATRKPSFNGDLAVGKFVRAIFTDGGGNNKQAALGIVIRGDADAQQPLFILCDDYDPSKGVGVYKFPITRASALGHGSHGQYRVSRRWPPTLTKACGVSCCTLHRGCATGGTLRWRATRRRSAASCCGCRSSGTTATRSSGVIKRHPARSPCLSLTSASTSSQGHWGRPRGGQCALPDRALRVSKH